jgi:hypothetical protein
MHGWLINNSFGFNPHESLPLSSCANAPFQCQTSVDGLINAQYNNYRLTDFPYGSTSLNTRIGVLMSNDLGRARMLTTELGLVLPHGAALSQIEESLWTVRLRDNSAVLIRLTDSPERLVLSAILGHAPADQQFALYELLLCYNLLWQATGGVRIGMDGPQGELVLVYDFIADSSSANLLKTVVLNVAALAHIWRAHIEGNNPPPDFQIDPGSAVAFA